MTPWRVVRVFISSTFRDMHAERDQLVKVVFPELRERLAPHRVQLIDIDLRWGVTKEQAENDRVLDLCLQQIDECRPYFLGILGERYGWLPSQFPVALGQKYGWLQHHTGKSVTELEILHGVLEHPGMHDHAFFYFRAPAVLDAIPEPIRSDVYAECDPERHAKLVDLKQRIRASGFPVSENYPARWQPDPHHPNQGRLVDLELFGQQVAAQLWQAFKTSLQLDEAPALASEWWDEESQLQERFIDDRQRLYIGRAALLAQLDDFVDAHGPSLCVVSGPAGAGKSALLARWVTRWSQSHPQTVFPHFVGGSPRSSALRSLVTRLTRLLDRHLQTGYVLGTDDPKIAQVFGQCLRSIPADRSCILVIDALNQLDPDARQYLGWLPTQLPPHVRLIVSCVSDDGPEGDTFRLLMKYTNAHFVTVPPLDRAEIQTIVREIPAISAKVLESEQIDLLLDNPATTNPLFLLATLEELRGFGSFEELTARIRRLPHDRASCVALFDQILARLEDDFGAPLVRAVGELLAASRRGLSEQELRELTTATPGADNLYPVLRQLRPFLVSKGAQLDFFHTALRQAVEQRYWPMPAHRATAHRTLANYFARQEYQLPLQEYLVWRERGWSRPDKPIMHRPPNRRKIDEWPWQALHAEAWDDLYAVLSALHYIETCVATDRTYEMLGDYALALAVLPSDHPTRQVLEPLAHALARRPEALRPDYVVPALWDLCWWHDHPQAGLFLETTQPPAPWERPGPKLYQLLEHWRTLCPLPASKTVAAQPPRWFLAGPMHSHWRGNGGMVEDIAIAPNGRWAAVPYPMMEDSDTIVLRQMSDGRYLQSLSVPSQVARKPTLTRVAWFPDSEHIAAYAPNYSSAYVWNALTGEFLTPLNFYVDENSHPTAPVPKNWRYIQDSEELPDGRKATVYTDGSRRIYNAAKQISLLPNGHVLLLCADDTLRLWDQAGTELRVQRLPQRYSPEQMSVRPDGRVAAIVLNHVLTTIFDIHEWRDCFCTSWKHKTQLAVLAADGQWLATATYDGSLAVWALPVSAPAQMMLAAPHVTLPSRHRLITTLALGADGRILVSGDCEGIIRVWDVPGQRMLTELNAHEGPITKLVLTADQRTLLSTARDGEVFMWDLAPERLAVRLRPNPSSG